jgi:hypothetical protein
MAQAHNEFPTYRPFLVVQTAAQRCAALTEAAKRFSPRGWLMAIINLGNSRHSLDWRAQSGAAEPQPGSIFDARYKGLTADAARLDAAICRQRHLR